MDFSQMETDTAFLLSLYIIQLALVLFTTLGADIKYLLETDSDVGAYAMLFWGLVPFIGACIALSMMTGENGWKREIAIERASLSILFLPVLLLGALWFI